MRRRLLLLLAAVVAAAAGARAMGEEREAPSCSRELSDEALEVLEHLVQPELSRLGFELPERCRLEASRGQYALQRAATIKVRNRHWRCRTCEKLFKTKDFLSRHFDRRHADLVPPNAVCLADMCEILPCRSEIMRVQRACDPDEMERRAQLCNAVVHRCFDPTHGGPELELHDTFSERFCDRLHCDRRYDEEAAVPHRAKTRWMYLGVAFLVTVLAVYYAVLYLTRRERTTRGDLARLSTTRTGGGLRFWESKKTKLF